MQAIIDNRAMHAVFEKPHPAGSIGPSAQYLREVGQMRPLLLLAFAPHAAGRHFCKMAVTALRGEIVEGSHAQGGRDASPYLPNFLSAFMKADTPAPVMHMHMQALAANRHFLEAFGIKPVIMLRSIADMLACFWDALDSDPQARVNGLNCHIPENFRGLSGAQKSDFVIDVIAPWYVSYFASWKNYADERPDDVCVLTYQDFCRQPSETMHAALTHAGFSLPASQCEKALRLVWRERIMPTYNESVYGRGSRCFSLPQRERLNRMLSYYPQLNAWHHILCEGFVMARAA